MFDNHVFLCKIWLEKRGWQSTAKEISLNKQRRRAPNGRRHYRGLVCSICRRATDPDQGWVTSWRAIASYLDVSVEEAKRKAVLSRGVVCGRCCVRAGHEHGCDYNIPYCDALNEQEAFCLDAEEGKPSVPVVSPAEEQKPATPKRNGVVRISVPSGNVPSPPNGLERFRRRYGTE